MGYIFGPIKKNWNFLLVDLVGEWIKSNTHLQVDNIIYSFDLEDVYWGASQTQTQVIEYFGILWVLPKLGTETCKIWKTASWHTHACHDTASQPCLLNMMPFPLQWYLDISGKISTRSLSSNVHFSLIGRSQHPPCDGNHHRWSYQGSDLRWSEQPCRNQSVTTDGHFKYPWISEYQCLVIEGPQFCVIPEFDFRAQKHLRWHTNWPRITFVVGWIPVWVFFKSPCWWFSISILLRWNPILVVECGTQVFVALIRNIVDQIPFSVGLIQKHVSVNIQPFPWWKRPNLLCLSNVLWIKSY